MRMTLNNFSRMFFAAIFSLVLNLNTAQAQSLGSYERSLASESDYTHAVQPALGFNRGQIVINADYEYRVTEHFGFGGNFYFTPDDDSSGYAEIIGIHAQAKVHVPVGDLDFFLRPGMGIAKIEYKLGGVDEDSTLISPLFGMGIMYRVADNIALGIEYLTLFNWTEDKAFETKSDFLLATQIRF